MVGLPVRSPQRRSSANSLSSGRPDLAKDKTLISVVRQLLHDKIDAAINTWASSKSPQECAQALQQIGIACSGEALNIADLLDHRHMKSSEPVYRH